MKSKNKIFIQKGIVRTSLIPKKLVFEIDLTSFFMSQEIPVNPEQRIGKLESYPSTIIINGFNFQITKNLTMKNNRTSHRARITLEILPKK